MNIFDRLVRENKRRKMLSLVVLLTFAAFFGHSNGINLTYILKSEDGKLHPNCIAEDLERYSAIGWIYPIPEREENLPNITTKFIPSIENEYNCKFSKNQKCNSIWTIKNWQMDANNSSRAFDLIFDTRWENFPTIFTEKRKDFKERIEIPSDFRVGFSVRAQDSVELIFCEGWNPYSYPCYHVDMGKTEIFLQKFNKFPKDYEVEDPLTNYTASSDILTSDEWRNFVVSLDTKGVFTLTDVNVNRTVIKYQDKEPIKPLYLLVRSVKPALWKIHQNEFMYTKTAQISRLGPMLNLASRDLCVSLYVSTCPNCAVKFIMMKGNDRIILKELPPTQKFEWISVKLKEQNVLIDKVNIFVETKFANPDTNQTEGFWAIDDVRVCHENEVKVSLLKSKEKIVEDVTAGDDISCQVVKHPKWRPKKLVYPKIQAFPTIENSSNSTSIHLEWTQEDPNSQINYFINYEANDICTQKPYNLRRIKSNGFLMTKLNEITIENLVPYTTYNITFSSMLHDTDRELSITTLESESPTPEEMPNRVQIQVTDSSAYISWESIDCTSIYGHILYAINVTNVLSNVTQEMKVQTENSIKIDNLQPFTLHQLDIATARTYENLENNTNVLKLRLPFTTKAAVAPKVEKLEVYSIDDNSASLRFEVPEKIRGIPKYVQVTKCNPLSFKKCKTSPPLPLNFCKLFRRKYCLDVDNLMSNQAYIFKVSIKNDNTPAFGEATNIEGYTRDRVPGPPSNITYRMVDCIDLLDYCHLNVSWLHPFEQNGTITGFDLVLSNTNNATDEIIKEFHKVDNKAYLPKYTHQIKFIPYSTHYEIYIQSVNTKFKSKSINSHIKTSDIGDHIDQKPKLLEKTDKSAKFSLPPVDPRLTSYKLTIIVQDYNNSIRILPKEIELNDSLNGNLCHNFGKTWLSQIVQVTKNTSSDEIVTIPAGNSDKTHLLEAKTQYCITFIVTNLYKNTEHDVVYFERLQTLEGVPKTAPSSESSQYQHLYGLLLLLLLIPIGFFLYRFWTKRRNRRKRSNNTTQIDDESNGNVYESLPFEECDTNNCVSNETYDHLLHK